MTIRPPNQLVENENIGNLFRDVNATYRVDNLYNTFHPTTEFICQSLQAIWIKSIQNNLSPEDVKSKILDLPCKVSGLYKELFSEESPKQKDWWPTYRMQKFNQAVNDSKKISITRTKDSLVLRFKNEISSELTRLLEAGTSDETLSLRDLQKSIAMLLDKLPSGLIEKYLSNEKCLSKEEWFNWVKDALSSLEMDLEKHVRPTTEEDLKNLWKMATNRESISLEDLKKELSKLGLPISIQDIYIKDLSRAQELCNVQAYAPRYFKEIDSTSFSPITPTSSGRMGHPKIIDWSIQKSNKSTRNISGFIKYLLSPIEMKCHHLYQFLIKDAENPLFKVPNGIMLDLQNSTYIDRLGSSFEIENTMNERFKTIFSYFSTIHTKRTLAKNEEIDFQLFIETKPIGIFERITKTNLSEFIKTNYKGLPQDKKNQLWERIGMLTYLDIMVGNRDRFLNSDLNYDTDPEQYQLLDKDDLDEEEKIYLTASNLENVMVSDQEDGILFYLIDNNLGDGTTSSDDIDPYDNNLYKSFLENILSKEYPEQALFTHFRKCFNKAIEDAIEETQTNDTQENFSMISKDLSEMAKELNPVISGMKKMKESLETKIIPNWESENSNEFKEKIGKSITKTIDERFNVLKATKNEPSNIGIL